MFEYFDDTLYPTHSHTIPLSDLNDPVSLMISEKTGQCVILDELFIDGMSDCSVDPNQIVASEWVDFSCLHDESQLAQHDRIVHSKSILR